MTELNSNLGHGHSGRGRPRTSVETVPSDHLDGQGYAPSPTINHGRAMGARTSMRIPRAMDTKLRALAQQDGTTEAAIVRCALEAYFNYRSVQTI